MSPGNKAINQKPLNILKIFKTINLCDIKHSQIE